MRRSALGMIWLLRMLWGCTPTEQWTLNNLGKLGDHKPVGVAPPATMATGDSSTEQRGMVCHADFECPEGELCNPDRDRCLPRTPSPQLLDQPLNEKEDCWLVNIYFAADSPEYEEDAERWLQYNLRCLRSLSPRVLVLKSYAAAHGHGGHGLRLSLSRGNRIKQALIDAGIEIPIEVRGWTIHRPGSGGSPEHYLAYNRRVEFWAR